MLDSFQMPSIPPVFIQKLFLILGLQSHTLPSSLWSPTWAPRPSTPQRRDDTAARESAFWERHTLELHLVNKCKRGCGEWLIVVKTWITVPFLNWEFLYLEKYCWKIIWGFKISANRSPGKIMGNLLQANSAITFWLCHVLVVHFRYKRW